MYTSTSTASPCSQSLIHITELQSYPEYLTTMSLNYDSFHLSKMYHNKINVEILAKEPFKEEN